MLTGYAAKLDPVYGPGKGDPMCGDVGPTDSVIGLGMWPNIPMPMGSVGIEWETGMPALSMVGMALGERAGEEPGEYPR